ncbi:retrotransposon protein, putative, ty1-copia subclass [Tanacetum coccineum]
MTTTVVNKLFFRAFFEKQRLTRPNFIDWYRNLWIMLSVEDKLPFLEQPIPTMPVPPVGQVLPPDVLATHSAWVKASKEIVGLMLMTMDPYIQNNLEQFGAYDMLNELKTLYVQQSYIDNLKRLGHAMTQNLRVSLILVSLRKEYDSFVQNYNMHGMGKTVTELHAMLKLHEQTLLKKDVAPALHVIRIGKGLRGSRKLKSGALSLYVGDGHRVAIEAIGSYHLCLPSGLVLVLHNCHYAPFITRAIILVSCLYDDGFINRFDGNTILVSKNNVAYFSAIPRNGIFEIDLSNSNTNDCSIFLDHLKKHGIIAHHTPPYTPQHIGVSERRNGTLLYMVRSMMSQPTLLKSFWDYALESDVRILNMVPTKKVEKTPYEVWHGQAPKLSYLKVYGCEALETMGYSFYYPPENKTLVAPNAKFLEDSFMTQAASRSLDDLEIIQEEDTHPSENTSLHHDEDGQEIDKPQSDVNPIRRSTRTRHALDRMCLYIDAEDHELGDHNEPANYKVALVDPESKKWLDVMNVEMQSMKDNEVWDLVDLPFDGKTVGSKWLFKKKTDMDGAVDTFKARLVAKGFTQTYGVDYEETFSHVADIRAIRILIAIAAFYDYEI